MDERTRHDKRYHTPGSRPRRAAAGLGTGRQPVSRGIPPLLGRLPPDLRSSDCPAALGDYVLSYDYRGWGAARELPGPYGIEQLADAYDSSATVEDALEHALTYRPLDAAVREQVAADSLSASDDARLAWPMDGITRDITAAASAIEVPVLVLAGEARPSRASQGARGQPAAGHPECANDHHRGHGPPFAAGGARPGREPAQRIRRRHRAAIPHRHATRRSGLTGGIKVYSADARGRGQRGVAQFPADAVTGTGPGGSPRPVTTTSA
jgi:hypothetical protein